MGYRYSYNPPSKRKNVSIKNTKIIDKIKKVFGYRPNLSTESGKSLLEDQKIVKGVIVVALLFSFIIVSSSITGYFAYIDDVEVKVSGLENQAAASEAAKKICDIDLKDKTSSLETCEDTLLSRGTNLDVCISDLSDEKKYSIELNDLFVDCQKEKDLYVDKFNKLTNDFDLLSEFSARAICCSFSDISSGVSSQWDIVNDTLVCSGSRTVDC